MQEKDFNTILTKNFQRHGFAYKIADPMVRKVRNKRGKEIIVTSPARPFDGFAVTEYGLIYWEAKFQKTLQAFPYSSLTDNQVLSLRNIKETVQNLGARPIYCVVVLGVWVPSRHIEIFSIDIDHIWSDLQKDKKSITKAELLGYEPTICKSKEFDVWNMLRKTIAP